VDGTGNPWFPGDVAIRADRIVAVGHLGGADATRVIDATGLVVAPGFIDLHTHSDGRLLNDGTAQSKVRQGVTLDVAGESSGQAPRDGMDAPGRGCKRLLPIQAVPPPQVGSIVVIRSYQM
jgi:N-acyl-D-aspartate/D-glutamate deacylase